MIRLLLIISYIFFCLLLRVDPRKYFQLNAPYFNERRGIFSKLDMDRLIPNHWQLEQFLDIGDRYPSEYPVFVKPEWGQNSHGIQRADNAADLDNIRRNRIDDKFNYLIQHAAKEKREFEIFIIPSADCFKDSSRLPGIISITETINRSNDHYPINGIYNKATHYEDITAQFRPEDLQTIWLRFQKVGHFRISRFGVRAASIKHLLAGTFQIIEINLFLPMPLTLISNNLSQKEKISFCFRCMWQLAKVTKTIPLEQPHKSVFFKKYKLSRSLKLTTKMRSYDERA